MYKEQFMSLHIYCDLQILLKLYYECQVQDKELSFKRYF